MTIDTKPPTLWIRMRTYASTMPHGSSRIEVLRLANQFETVVKAWNDQTATSKEMLGCWAKCRRYFAAVGGEPL